MTFQRDPLLGRTLAGHHIQATVGNGNMGRIYRAVPAEGGAPVAIKVLQRELAREAELVERFQREFTNSSRIRHPNVVELYEAGITEDGVHYQIQELLDGVALDTLLGKPFALSRIASLGAQVAAALEAAHEVSIVHRDLKPENIMLLGIDEVKVFDFGLARAEISNQPKLTAVELRLGTPHYMAPEYIENGDLDHRVDLYALGVVLYELATGQTPFDGPPYKILHQHVTAEAPRLKSVSPSADPRLDALVASLLAKDPEDRPPHAGVVESRLRALL